MTENKYCRALAELRSKPAHELKEVGDQWRTPDLLFWGINAMFGPLVWTFLPTTATRSAQHGTRLKIMP
jgi:hypothetical protein